MMGMKKELAIILANHAQWVPGRSLGQQANLSHANLSYTYLSGATGGARLVVALK